MSNLATIARLPDITLYADGTAVLLVDAEEGWPRAKLLAARLKPAAVSRVRDEAAKAGLLDAPERLLKLESIGDAPITRFIVQTEKGRFVTMVAGLRSEDARLAEKGDVASRRRRAASFLEWIRTMPRWPDLLEQAADYTPARAAVLSSILRSAPRNPLPDWPLPLGPVTVAGREEARCFVAEGQSFETAKRAAAAATSFQGREDSTSTQIGVTLRPLLPDEVSCADLWVTGYDQPAPREPASDKR